MRSCRLWAGISRVRTIDAQAAPNAEPIPVPNLSRPYLVLDCRQFDHCRIEDGESLPIQVEGGLAGGEQVEAPIGVVAIHQRDDKAASDGLCGEGRHVRATALATDVVQGCGSVVRPPGPAESHRVRYVLCESAHEPVQPNGHLAHLLGELPKGCVLQQLVATCLAVRRRPGRGRRRCVVVLTPRRECSCPHAEHEQVREHRDFRDC